VVTTRVPHAAVPDPFPLLWPSPKHCWRLSGEDACALGTLVVVRLPVDAAPDQAGVRSAAWELLVATFGRCGVALSPTRSGDKVAAGEAGGIALYLNSGGAAGYPGGYRLTVCSRGVALVAADAAGLLFGAMALCQLAALYATTPAPTDGAPARGGRGHLSLPAVVLEDYPGCRSRAALLDARFPCCPTRERLLRTVKLLASFRFNTIHLMLDTTAAAILPASGTSTSNLAAAGGKSSAPSSFPSAAAAASATASSTASSSASSSALSKTKVTDLVDVKAPSPYTDLLELDALCQHHFVALVPVWVLDMASLPPPSPSAAAASSAHLAYFRQISGRTIALLVAADPADPAASAPAAVAEAISARLDLISAQGHFDSVHLLGLSREVATLVTRDPFRFLPLALALVDDLASSKGHGHPFAPLHHLRCGGDVGGGGFVVGIAGRVASVAEAAAETGRFGPSGVLVQGRPLHNPLYPSCLEDMFLLAAGGLAWSGGSDGGGRTRRALARVHGGDFPAIVRQHLYPGGDNAAADVATLVAVALAGNGRPHRGEGVSADTLWQLHVHGSNLPWDLWAADGRPQPDAAADIADAYAHLLKMSRDHKWTRQNGAITAPPLLFFLLSASLY
jgi:hypothetical protein